MAKKLESRAVFLDTASAMPLLSEVRDALLAQLLEEESLKWGWNLDGQHRIGLFLKERYQQDLMCFLESLGVAPIEWYWTSGATESNNWAVAILGAQTHIQHLVLHPLLHSSLEKSAIRLAQEKGWTYEYLTVLKDEEQEIDQKLSQICDPRHVAYLSSWGDNELGLYDQKMKNIAAFFHQAGAWVHLDLAQSFAKSTIDMHALPCSSAAISAHKIGAFCGLGALYIKTVAQKHISSIFVGGRQQYAKRAGTLPLVLIYAFFEAVRAWTLTERYKKHCERLSLRIQNHVLDRSWLLSLSPIHLEERLSHIYSFLILSEHAEKMIVSLKEKGFSFSQASTCHLGQPAPSLLRYGIDPLSQKNMVRMSVGPANTQEEIDLFFSALDHCKL